MIVVVFVTCIVAVAAAAAAAVLSLVARLGVWMCICTVWCWVIAFILIQDTSQYVDFLYLHTVHVRVFFVTKRQCR